MAKIWHKEQDVLGRNETVFFPSNVSIYIMKLVTAPLRDPFPEVQTLTAFIRYNPEVLHHCHT
jgi:hypothetical protein